MFVSKEIADYRLSFCQKPCEHNINGICKRCGCVIRVKVRLEIAECPIGLWKRQNGKEVHEAVEI
jgi:hypothetical protein